MGPVLLLAAAVVAMPVDRHRWNDRLLLVFAPDAASSDLAAQRRDAAAAAAAYAERDIVVVEVVGDAVRGAADPAADLRRRFHAPPGRFRAVLVGKDGHVALASPTPLTADRLAPVIDAMPMRRDELRRR